MCDKALKLFEEKNDLVGTGTMFYWFLHEKNIKYSFRWTRIGPYVPDGHALWCTKVLLFSLLHKIISFKNKNTKKIVLFFIYYNTGRRKSTLLFKSVIIKCAFNLKRNHSAKMCYFSRKTRERHISITHRKKM